MRAISAPGCAPSTSRWVCRQTPVYYGAGNLHALCLYPRLCPTNSTVTRCVALQARILPCIHGAWAMLVPVPDAIASHHRTDAACSRNFTNIDPPSIGFSVDCTGVTGPRLASALTIIMP